MFIGISSYKKIAIEYKGEFYEISSHPAFSYLKQIPDNLVAFSKCMESYQIRQDDSVTLHNPLPNDVERELNKLSDQLKKAKG